MDIPNEVFFFSFLLFNIIVNFAAALISRHPKIPLFILFTQLQGLILACNALFVSLFLGLLAVQSFVFLVFFNKKESPHLSDVAQEPSFGPAERKARTFILGGLLLVSCLLGFLLVKERTDILGKAFKNMFSASTTLLFREPFLVSLGVILVLLTFLGSVKSSQNQEHYSEEEE